MLLGSCTTHLGRVDVAAGQLWGDEVALAGFVALLEAYVRGLIALNSRGADDAIGGIGFDHVGDVSDALVVEAEIAEVGLARVDQDAKQFEDSLLVLSSGERAHRWLHEVELLLEVVEADLSVDAVPVEHLVIDEGRGGETTVDVFLVEDIEHCLEEG